MAMTQGDAEVKKLANYFRGRYCPNCLAGGKGLVAHTVKECQSLGNQCFMNCPMCASLNKLEKHWADACPNH